MYIGLDFSHTSTTECWTAYVFICKPLSSRANHALIELHCQSKRPMADKIEHAQKTFSTILIGWVARSAAARLAFSCAFHQIRPPFGSVTWVLSKSLSSRRRSAARAASAHTGHLAACVRNASSQVPHRTASITRASFSQPHTFIRTLTLSA